MANILGDDQKQQILALGRLGWSLRRIEQATGVRRETASAYLKAAGIAIREPRRRRPPSKPAIAVSTDPANPASEDARTLCSAGSTSSSSFTRRMRARGRSNPASWWRSRTTMFSSRPAGTSASGSRIYRSRRSGTGRPHQGRRRQLHGGRNRHAGRASGGVTFAYFGYPGNPAKSVVPRVPDPVTNRYRFKLGKGHRQARRVSVQTVTEDYELRPSRHRVIPGERSRRSNGQAIDA
jgi:hypothetical protein